MIDKFEKFLNFIAGVKPRINRRTSEKPVYANFNDRLFASLLDVLIIFTLFQDFFSWTSRLIYKNYDPNQLLPPAEDLEILTTFEKAEAIFSQLYRTGFLELWVINSILQSIVVGVVLVAAWSYFHTTFGKFLLGLKFADATTHEPPTPKQYIRRFLGYFLSMPPMMLGFAMLGFSEKKQAWHDKIGSTVVIYTKEGHIIRRLYDFLRAKYFPKKPPSNDN